MDPYLRFLRRLILFCQRLNQPRQPRHSDATPELPGFVLRGVQL